MSVAERPGYQLTPLGWLPLDWEVQRLSALTKSYAGGTPDRSKSDYFEGDIPWVKSGEVNLRKITKTEEHISELALSKSSAKLAESGSVLVAMYGATAGKVARLRIDAAINQAVLSIRSVGDGLDNDFLFWVMESSAEKLLSMCQGAAQPNLSKGLIDGLEVATPPLPEQQKIAAILTAVDDKLDVIARQIEATETLKQGLMQTLFSRGVGTQDADGRWVPHTEFKDSELGEIPAGWECMRLGDVLAEKPEYGANASAVPFDAANRIRYLRITDIDENGRLRSDSIKAIPSLEAKDYILSDGDLLIARSGNTVGKSILYKSAMGLCAFAGYLLRFRFGPKMLVEFVAEYLTSDTYWAWVKASVKVGAQPNINAQQYQSMFIPVPPTEEQQRIAAVLAGVDAKIELLGARQTQFQNLKRGLMQKLLTGEWRVSVDASATGS